MGVLQRIKHDLKTGWAGLRYGTARVAGRALEETELLSLRLELRKLDDRLKDLHRDIGERAVELHERGEPAGQIVSDFEIARRAEEVRKLKVERARLLADMQEVRTGT
ncbi:MAG: hypothetical protein EPO64_09730 [Nitrospirae bacterium]|nr:MAG: hypothetical protein EPO64_09730 [Nitrospirota bacterium]